MQDNLSFKDLPHMYMLGCVQNNLETTMLGLPTQVVLGELFLNKLDYNHPRIFIGCSFDCVVFKRSNMDMYRFISCIFLDTTFSYSTGDPKFINCKVIFNSKYTNEEEHVKKYLNSHQLLDFTVVSL